MTEKGHSAEDSDYLHYELDRARVVADETLPFDVVRVGSTVTYRSEGEVRTVELVYPGTGVAPGKISVLAPIGAALVGLRPGQSITRMGWDGDFRRFTVLAVTPPSPLQ